MTKIQKGIGNLFTFLGVVCSIIFTTLVAITSNMLYFVNQSVWMLLIIITFILCVIFYYYGWKMKTYTETNTARIFCPNCGKSVELGITQCTQCGHSLDS